MKYSFMSFSTPALTLKETLDAAKRFGYDGFEPRLVADHAHGLETTTPADVLIEARRMAEDAGVAYSCVATSCRLAIPELVAEQTDDAKRAVDLAEKLGCRAIRVFGGVLPEGLSREKAAETLNASVSKLAAYGKTANVYVCLETHDHWCDPVTVGEVAKVSGCAVNWDIMHTFNMAGVAPERSFELLRPYVRHMHIHDGKRNADGGLTLCPVGEGVIDHATPLALMQGAGYTGYVSGEWISWEPWEVHLPREIALLKALA